MLVNSKLAMLVVVNGKCSGVLCLSMVHNCLHQKAAVRQVWRTAAFPSPMWPVDDIFVLPVVITWLCRDTYGHRALAVAGLAAWNSLSDDLYYLVLSTDSFSHLLKTRFFIVLVHTAHYKHYALYKFTTYLLVRPHVTATVISRCWELTVTLLMHNIHRYDNVTANL